MKTTKHSLVIFLLLVLNPLVFSQNSREIVYWNDPGSGLCNFRVISVLEGMNKEIYLLSKASNEDYKNLHPNFTSINFRGKILNTNTITTGDVYDLNCIVILPGGKIRVAGTTTSGGTMMPYNEIMDASGKSEPHIFDYNIAPVFTGNVFRSRDDSYIETISAENPVDNSSNSGFGMASTIWNIWLYKKDYQNQDVSKQEQWHCKIDSRYNEEPVNTIQNADSSYILLARRYVSNDYSTFIPVIYCISPEGHLSWSKEFSGGKNYNSASIVNDNTGNIFSVFAFADDNMKSNHTLVYLNSLKGDSLRCGMINKLCANGGVLNNDNNIILFGGIYKTEDSYIIKRGTTILIDNNLEVLNQNSLDMFDSPDCDIPGIGLFVPPTSSDFLCGLRLSDGRFIFGGRVYMPKKIQGTASEILKLPRYNQNLVVFTNNIGDFGIYRE